MEKRAMSDKNKNVVSTFAILVFAVALFFFLFFSTNLFNGDATSPAQIRKIEKKLANIEIPEIPEAEFIEDTPVVPENSAFQGVPSLPSVNALDDYGFIAHSIHTAFAEAYDFEIDDRAVSISDSIIYNTGYYSVNGAAWEQFSLQGTAYGGGQPWLLDDASGSLPSDLDDEGTHYVIIFSCELNGEAWDCHGDMENGVKVEKWQLYIIENGDPGCTPDCDGRECGSDGCGGSCPPGCSGSTPRCSGGQCVAVSSGGALIADHNSADDYDRIPQCWIDRAKSQFDIGYEGTSHGSQFVNGLHYFESGFSFHDDTMGGDCSQRDGAIYSPTKSYLDSHGNINVIVWSWCSIRGHDIDRYLTDMDRLRSEYPNVQFVHMTGHLEGTGPSGSVENSNNQIRAHVSSTNGILFDFADIETYNPDGVAFPNGNDNCDWCVSWCNSHSNDPGCSASISCSHSNEGYERYNCYRKGQAAWWMFARMAGWDGVSQTC